MNKYNIHFCDINNRKIKKITVVATSISACQEKVMQELIEMFDMEDVASNYREFVKIANSEYNIVIGEIEDIEEL